MKPAVNLLLTSLSTLGDRKSHRYFYFEKEGNTQYCDGLSVAEAGAKYILANVDIDEIIVLGAGSTYKPGEENKRIVLREWSDFTAMDTAKISEYSFFQYRIAQFLDGLDMEAVDVLEDTEGVRADEILEGYRKFCAELAQSPSYRPDRVFHIISSDEEKYDRLLDYMPELSDKELLWLERLIYTQFADTMKLSRREDNTDIGISFVPTSHEQNRDYVPAENVAQIVSVLNDIDAQEVNIYMDMQGLASAEGYTILAVLSMLSNDQNSRIFIREIITSHYRPGRFANPIDNREMKRYDINNLVSGMNAFIRYGKVDEIQAYWDSRGIENQHIESLLYAMRRVDEGISLCNTGDLESGINMLKNVFANTPKEELPEVESNIFRILEDTIRQDYGAILEGDSVDPVELVRWAMRKKFYQQSLTIIESRLPQNIVDSGIYYYAADPESREKFLEEINLLYWDYAPKDRWNFNDLAHFFIKYYGRTQIRSRNIRNSKDRQRDFAKFRIDELDNKAEEMTKAFSVLYDRKDLLEDVLYTYYHLGDIRNRINHAEVSESEDIRTIDIGKENDSLVLLRDGINAFLKAYDAAREYMRENVIEPVNTWQIPPEEVSSYTAAHKLFPNEIREIRAGSKPEEKSDKPADRPADKPAPLAAGDVKKSVLSPGSGSEPKNSGNRSYGNNRSGGSDTRRFTAGKDGDKQTVTIEKGNQKVTITITVE